MRRLRPSSEAEMVALFLRTELPAARSRDDLRALLERVGVPERVVADLGDDAENRARLGLLICHRGYGTHTELFDGFPYDVRWQWMAITPAALVRVRYIDYDWSQPARSRPLMIRYTTRDLRMRAVRYQWIGAKATLDEADDAITRYRERVAASPRTRASYGSSHTPTARRRTSTPPRA